MKPEVTIERVLDMQVCVPKDWDDEQVISFAETEYPCGTSGGWMIRKEGNPTLLWCSERERCSDKSGYVHIMLDA